LGLQTDVHWSTLEESAAASRPCAARRRRIEVKPLSLWIRRTLIVFFLAPLVLGMGFNEQAFECENAVAHLEACCRTFTAASSLCPQPFSCGGEASIELSTAESACIKDLDCSAVRSRGLCAKASALMAQASSAPPAGPTSDAPRAPVCP
jgi:hypothetical protein